METLAQYLDRLMRQKHITPKELSRQSGLTDSYITRLRSGKQDNPTVDTLKKLATGLGVSAHELFTAASGVEPATGLAIDLALLLELMRKLISEPSGFEAFQRLMRLTPRQQQELLDKARRCGKK
jgi:transcriptional regulator with XRE-family HTH domain